MQTSLETLGQLERRLTMSVPVAQIETEINERLARLAKNAKIPGFRPGKVPRRVIEARMGGASAVRGEALREALDG